MRRNAVILSIVVLMFILTSPIFSQVQTSPPTPTSTVAPQEIPKENPKEGKESASPTSYFIFIVVSCAFAMALAAVGAAFSQARAAVAALDGVARQPEASGKIQVQMILALVFIETLAIYTLVVVLILLFANPFTKYVVG